MWLAVPAQRAAHPGAHPRLQPPEENNVATAAIAPTIFGIGIVIARILPTAVYVMATASAADPWLRA